MKKTKNILSLLLCLLMVISALPICNMGAYALRVGDFLSADGLWRYSTNDLTGVAYIKEYLGYETDVTVPATIDGRKVLKIFSALYSTPQIKKLKLSEGIQMITSSGGTLETDNLTRSALEYIELPSTLKELVYDYKVLNVSTLKAITVSEDSIYYASEDGVLYNADKTELICYPANKSDAEFTVPESVTSINQNAFYQCRNLKVLNMSDNVKQLGSYFCYWCPKLEQVNISKGVTQLCSNSFSLCGNLKELNIPGSVSAIGSSVARACISLESVVIEEGCKSIATDSFRECTSLERAVIPSSVTSIKGTAGLDTGAFAGCPELVIYGYRNTTAEEYANLMNIAFAALDGVAGDIDGDGNVSIEDYSFIKNILSGEISEVTDNQIAFADVNGDGTLDAFDLFFMDRFINDKTA